MPKLTSPDHTYIAAEVPIDLASAFKRRAHEHDRSAAGQLRHLIREFARGDERPVEPVERDPADPFPPYDDDPAATGPLAHTTPDVTRDRGST